MPDHYGTIAEADAYHEARGNTAWAALTDSPDQKTAPLIRASQWLDGAYASRWPGRRVGGRDQARAWPRENAKDAEGNEVDDATVPPEVLMATYEAALREAVTPGSLSPDFTPADGVKSEAVGPVSVTYRDGVGVEGQRPIVTVIDDILASLIGRRSSGVSTAMLKRA